MKSHLASWHCIALRIKPFIGTTRWLKLILVCNASTKLVIWCKLIIYWWMANDIFKSNNTCEYKWIIIDISLGFGRIHYIFYYMSIPSNGFLKGSEDLFLKTLFLNAGRKSDKNNSNTWMVNNIFISWCIIALLNLFVDFSCFYVFLLHDHNICFNGSL